MKTVLSLLLALIGAVDQAGAQMPPRGGELPPIEVQKLRANVFLVAGAHANTVVFVRSKDVVVIDTKGPGPLWGGAIADEVKRLTNLPITTIINTSASGSHVGGNPEFAGGKMEIIAHEYAAADMRKMTSMFTTPMGGGLPTRTFRDRLTVGNGADRLELYYFGPTTNRSSEVHRDFMRDFLEYARHAKTAGKTPAAAALPGAPSSRTEGTHFG